jgi:DNA-binding MarR family transcriptional regulator
VKSDAVEFERSANLLGALSLVIADRMSDAVAGASGQSATGATALSALHHFLDRPTVDLLRRVLGLTSSGTVRLLDRLAEAGYVRRGSGTDRRSTAIGLTAAGRRAAKRVSAARAVLLEDALSVLSPDERATLEAVTSRLLVGLMREPGATRWMCRLCDTDACGRQTGNCPVANAAMERYGPDARP